MISRTRLFATGLTTKSLRCRSCPHIGISRRFHSSPKSERDEPLHILFCGSDDFSIASLRALYHHSRLPDSNIASIDVATRPDKRVGRGRQNIVAPPIKHAAEQLMLPVHQFDTFRGWNLPTRQNDERSYINMVIAVSFGLLVPPRILRQCQFGGLNVHPSLLPDLKGSSPVEHSIIFGDQRTGVTVQTLHESKFDEGEVVLQTPRPGILIPGHSYITASKLRDVLSEIGAEMLVRALRDRLYLKPQSLSTPSPTSKLRMAPKLTTESQHVKFATMTSAQVIRLGRALGELWATPVVPPGTKGVSTDARLKFTASDLRLASAEEAEYIPADILATIEPGRPFCVRGMREKVEHHMSPLLVKAADHELLAVPRMIVSGMPLSDASILASRARLFDDEAIALPDSNLQLFRFRHLLS